MLRGAFVLALLLATQLLAAEQAEHASGVDSRGDKGMGFSHQKVSHHFGLTKAGGFITAEAKDPADLEAVKPMITGHFAHIGEAFKKGDFELPMFIHGRTPPGVPEMKRLRADIDYTFRETPRGGQIEVTSKNVKAIEAIHRFLVFQIKDHRTGDSTAIQP